MSILSFSNLSYSYDKKKNIFSNISAEMELGKIYAILGPSGCGKTTLLSLDIKFLNGTYKLEEGRHINPDDSCTVLISKELADKNNLSVGDKITFQEFETGKTESTFTIVGIYSGTEGTTKQAITPDGIPANSGYIDMDGLKKFYDGVNEKLEGYDNLDIYTHSPEEAKELMETIKNLPEVKGKTFTFDVNAFFSGLL
jgi:putative ABC transport system permease protein